MNTKKHRSLRSGFSIIEIVIAMALVAIMMGVGVPLVINRLKQGRVDSTKTSLHGYKQAIEMFYADTGSYPTELNDLIEKPADERIAAKWSSQYMERLADDGWGHQFVYERTAQAEHPYELYSYGPEGEDGPEEARLSVWE